MVLRLLFIILLCSVGAAIARDNGRYKGVPDEIRNWFNEQTSPEDGRSCCSLADGFETQEDIRNGQYWATIEGNWYPVPPSRVIHKGNPVGRAVVWYTFAPDPTDETYPYLSTKGAPIIHCFIPGPGI